MLLPDREALNDAHPDGPNDLAAATGGEASEVWKDRVKVAVEDGMLDVTAAAPLPPGMKSRGDVEGRAETVLANAQILRGKLNRTHNGVTRDAFDLVSAAKADEKALQQATNALTRKRMAHGVPKPDQRQRRHGGRGRTGAGQDPPGVRD